MLEARTIALQDGQVAACPGIFHDARNYFALAARVGRSAMAGSQ